MQFTIIGIDDNQHQEFKQEVKEIISRNTIFSGGKRHYEIVKDYLPQQHRWIEIKVPLSQIFETYKHHAEIVVFASGDPFFFGFGNTIQRYLPDAQIHLFPHFNSLQQLAHKMLLPYQEMHIVSLTGRPWHKFDEALILGFPIIGVLTDKKEHTPKNIARRMLLFGFSNYTMTVGELLGNNEKETFTTLSLEQVTDKSFAFPNNIILQQTSKAPRPFGIPEKDFHLLNGRANMITKMPIRLLSLSLLDLRNRKTFWDIGFCTGSVSIEAKLQFPHLNVISFEKRPEGKQLLVDNMQKFHAPGIKGIIGDFTQEDLAPYPTPEAVFIGGHGGKMHEIFAQFTPLLSQNGIVVFNSVSESSKQLFYECTQKFQLTITDEICMQVDDFNTILVLKAIKH